MSQVDQKWLLANTRDFEVAPVKRVRDAVVAHCPTCDFWLVGCWAWDWRKSQLMHERGTGHRTEMMGYVD